MIHLATAIALREDSLLMVASRYPNHAQPLWNLPGGRQLPGELLEETVVREVFEETGLHVDPGEVAYVSESYDGDAHILNVTFSVILRQDQDNTRLPPGNDTPADDHVVAVEWVNVQEVGKRMVVAVVREPLLAFLRGSLERRYAGFHQANVTIEWPPNSR